ncbi:cupredoxin domain-containing protein [Rhizobium sp. P32RR-XVIII]|uniref:cupredoxin domain-containing protein n=1 Tax=Rhizobium sp. P32RR-XVIII TaxID=2726738 RepID=UPI001FF00E92|nr:cupredoxin domain-containing protein [Rhizobium sp. P32RR-XVIII]
MTLAALPAHAATVQVVLDKLGFQPVEVTVVVGDTIEWVNKDPFAHTATVKGGFDVVIAPHKSGSMVMNKAGSLDYFCRFHPNMRGRITVTER